MDRGAWWATVHGISGSWLNNSALQEVTGDVVLGAFGPTVHTWPHFPQRPFCDIVPLLRGGGDQRQACLSHRPPDQPPTQEGEAEVRRGQAWRRKSRSPKQARSLA